MVFLPPRYNDMLNRFSASVVTVVDQCHVLCAVCLFILCPFWIKFPTPSGLFCFPAVVPFFVLQIADDER